MPDDRAIAHTHARTNRIAAIRNGALPSNGELLSGLPFLRGSAELDCQAWIDCEIQRMETIGHDHPELRKAFASLRVKFGAPGLKRVIKANLGQLDIEERALIYIGAIEPVLPERSRVAAMALARVRVSSLDGPFFLATALGLMSSRKEDFDECRTEGFKVVDNLIEVLKRLRDAAKEPEPKVADLDMDDEDDFMQAVLDDRAEFLGNGTHTDPLRVRTKQQRPGTVVLAKYDMPLAGKDDRSRTKREFESIAGKRLPFVETGDVHAQGARRIALQSVAAGIGLSILGMIAAAFGYLTPVQGALLQEAIDVAVILNALRALRIAPRELSLSDPAVTAT